MNNGKEKLFNKAVVQLVSVVVLFFIYLLLLPWTAQKVYIKNYLVDGLCLFGVILLLISYANKNKFDMFEPIYFISAIYVLMYFITPIYDILTEEYLWYGYNLFEYGVTSSLIAFLGYFAFYVFYRFSFEKGKDRSIIFDTLDQQNERSVASDTGLIAVILVMYVVCFVANLWYLVQYYGASLLYVLTLGLLGEMSGTPTDASIGFISMLSYCLPTTVLLYWEYGKSKLLKIILFVPMLMMQITRGFRFFVIQIFVTFFAYYFIRKGKRPKLKALLGLFVLLMIPVLLMTLFRDTIRAGGGLSISTFSASRLKEGFDAAFWDNLRIYQNFYGMVGVIPEEFGFVYGRQMIVGTLVMMIPRALWPGKISMYGGEGLVTLIGANIAAGQAYPNLGEYYYAIGVFGVVLFMSLYGWWMKRERVKNMPKRSGGLNNIIFAVLLGANLQLIIRGYTPSNFWYLIFSILPVIILKFLFPKIERGRDK